MSRTSTYREIANEITDRIHRGDPGYLPGDQIPSYADLAAAFSVSVSTAARAVSLLHERQVVHSVVGRGVYVREVEGWIDEASRHS
jgi:GntR family transcriptional regulator